VRWAIHGHPKERTPVSGAEDLDEMVKAGLICRWDGEADSDGPSLTGLSIGHGLIVRSLIPLAKTPSGIGVIIGRLAPPCKSPKVTLRPHSLATNSDTA
jgi:hypothetical protein